MTFICQSQPGMMSQIWDMWPDLLMIYAPEVIEKYGDMNDWYNNVGTGPFILVDYVTAASATFVKNPNYWMHDPFRPENQLPYLDGVRHIYIPDAATATAALRTAKIDWLTAITWEAAAGLRKINPELVNLCYAEVANQGAFMWRMDKFDRPWQDKRVRHALYMAVDQQAIANDYYGGLAAIFMWSVPPNLQPLGFGWIFHFPSANKRR